MKIGDDFKPYFRPRYLYTLEAHVTEPRPCWHDNPVLVLARELQQMELANTIKLNGYIVRKTWSKHTGNRYAICDSSGRFVKACKRADEAAEFVLQGTGMEEYHGA